MGRLVAIAALVHLAGGLPALAQGSADAAASDRYTPIRVTLDKLDQIAVTIDGDPPGGNHLRDCQVVSSLTDANFEGDTFVAQAGFAEQEIAAASYAVPADQFPIRIDLMEVIVVTLGATRETVTEWSVLIWDGTPDTGILVAEYSSDDITLPHIRLGPGDDGVNVQVSIDPGDPTQIYIYNDSGQNRVTLGFRIDKHNSQTQDPCLFPPPSSLNAFPCTDVSGLAYPNDNWIKALDCGPFGCPAGWRRFSQFGDCQPSGDWVMRLTWSSVDCDPGLGACCLTDGSCQVLSAADCQALGGTFQGTGTDCDSVNCDADEQACCFESTGGCLDLTPADCLLAGGIPAGPGTSCATHVCFPIGACCLPDGSCIDGVSPDDCAALGGVFQGDGTECATTDCPEPTGACCFDTGGCLVLTEADCATAGGVWQGPGTDCSDVNGDGTADACQSCTVDLNADGLVNSQDFILYLNLFVVGDPGADYDGSGSVNSQDFISFLNDFVAGC